MAGRIFLAGASGGIDEPPAGGPLHIAAAADAGRRALSRGGSIYNIAESDGTVLSRKAETELGWRPDFRIG